MLKLAVLSMLAVNTIIDFKHANANTTNNN